MRTLDEIEELLMSFLNKRNKYLNLSEYHNTDLLNNVIHSNEIEKPIEFRNVTKQIFLKFFTENKYVEEDLEILKVVTYNLNNGKKIISFLDEEKWIEVFSLADQILFSNHDNRYKIDTSYEFIDEVITGKSIKNLRSLGYNLKITNGSIQFINNDRTLLLEEIDTKIKEIGGINFLNFVFAILPKKVHFDDDINEYMFYRKYFELNGDYKPKTPWNYLVQVAFKYFNYYNHHKESPFKKMNLYLEIIELAKDYFVLLNIQDSNKYQHLFIERHDLNQYLSKNVFHDNIFALPQNNFIFYLELTNELLSPLYSEYKLEKKFGFSLKEYSDFFGHLVKFNNFKNLKKINISDLYIKNIDMKKKEKILSVIAIKNNALIRRTKKNFTFNYPLILTSKKSGYLMPIPMYSLSVFELISSKLRDTVDNFDQRLGEGIEAYLRKKLQENSIQYSFGYYNDNEECDLIIESKKHIVFIEIKKKALTSDSKSGQDVYIFSDLAKSLISSQNQLLKHENEIMDKGFLSIRENRSNKPSRRGIEKKIYLENKQIIKISLSAYDYGFINDSVVVKNVLSKLINISVKSIDREHEEIIDEFNKQLYKLQQNVQISIKNKFHKHDNLFFNSNFLSLQQIFYIIEKSKDVEEFAKILNNLLRITDGSANFYRNVELAMKY